LQFGLDISLAIEYVPRVRHAPQLPLALSERPGWGGRRPGSGRKRRVGLRPCVPHRSRRSQSAHEPALVTLRATRDVGSLRAPAAFRAIRSTLSRTSTTELRVVHFSVQTNHVHLIVEADGARSFTSGMRSLTTRLALAVNRTLARRGRIWSDRFHTRALTTPRAVRTALVYVLANAYKHMRVRAGLDPCSSARAFDGFADRPSALPRAPADLPPPRTWLLRIGWRRHGLLSTSERPAGCRYGPDMVQRVRVHRARTHIDGSLDDTR